MLLSSLSYKSSLLLLYWSHFPELPPVHSSFHVFVFHSNPLHALNALLIFVVSPVKFDVCLTVTPLRINKLSEHWTSQRLYAVLLRCHLKMGLGWLPWWRSGWESACRCRGHRSGRIPHAAEQLGPWATTTEPVRLELVLCNKEAAALRGPRTATRESPRTETKTQHSQINK